MTGENTSGASGDHFIRNFKQGEEREVVQFLDLVFEGWPKVDLSHSSLDHWRWKYLDNPVGITLVTVCYAGDKVVGVRHSIPQNIKVANSIHLCTYAGDTGVHPSFRRRGIFTGMWKFNEVELKKHGFKSSYWVTSNPLLIRSYKGRRPEFPHPITNLVWIQDIDMQLEAMPTGNMWLKKTGYRAVKFFNRVRNLVKGSRRRAPDIDISTIENFDDRIDKFWARVSGYYNYIVRRDREYLNWRYCDPRGGDFIVRLAEGDDGIKGFSVLRINRYRDDYSVGFVMDLLAPPDRLEVVQSLTEDAIYYFNENDVNIVNYQVVRGHPYESVFKRHGFVDSRINIYLFLYPGMLEEAYERVGKNLASRVHYSYGDIDSLPVELPGYV